MTFEQFAAIVRDWQSRFTPARARECAESLRRQVYISDLPDEIPLDAVLAAIARGGPVPVPERRADEAVAAPKRQPCKSKKAKSGTGQGVRGRPSKRAQTLVREQLADGPRLGEQVLAAASRADIGERTVITAADALGVRARRGQWWLPQVALL